MKYFDYAASCPLDHDAAELYVKAATDYSGNSQSLHDIGSHAQEILENCRMEMAKLLNVQRDGVFFTSGGSESNLLTIYALLSATKSKGRHIITNIAEHSSVINVMKKLEEEGYEITYLPLNAEGVINVADVEQAIRKDTVLVSIQHANPEIGTLQPIIEISTKCKEKGIFIQCDCVQSFGKVEIQEVASAVDALSISGHKFYGPKGTGVAFVNPRHPRKPFLTGTTHEKGFRPGTVNVPGIIAMTSAAQKAINKLQKERSHYTSLRNLFLNHFNEFKEQVTIYHLEDNRQLPHIIGMRIHGKEGQWMMLECNRNGYAVSTGTACHTGLLEPSKTMTAMGIDGKMAKEFFRISFGRQTTEADVKKLAQLLLQLRD
ncbi:IscS subfamily cysteine desulfurase [Bacillus sp. B15-48]|uniref:IscS subfamily cysteine desulfurase n=1 Tax=Bacillus sp. B15-48 TaxID=1548601 RepID=UPI00193FA45C|nr:IscS subfamily cysteine desulfurase [Bacillus sp. B15-48]MBM4762421.1 aminotransferase class V-fold PLP-dependent enzyme [Bacillus sp. B15-48]